MKYLLATTLLLAGLSFGQDLQKETKDAPKAEGRVEAKPASVKHVDAKAAAKLLAAEKKPTVLDLRTPPEFKQGHLANAINIDFFAADFAEKIGKLDRKKSYIVHCKSGGRSGRSLELFKKLGFAKIIHLDGGVLAWEKAELPFVR